MSTTNQKLPENLPIELLPVYDWWKEKGPQTIIQVAIAVLVFAGVYGGVFYFKNQNMQAGMQLVSAENIDELEVMTASYGKTKPGILAKLKLAKAYFDNGRAEQALQTYDDFLKNHGSNPFAAVAELGRGQALSALGKQDEAREVFQKFIQAREGHYLIPEATLGLARTWALGGDKAKAKEILDALAKTRKDTVWAAVAEQLSETIDRYQPRAARSLFDLADAAAAKVEAAKAGTNAPAAKTK